MVNRQKYQIYIVITWLSSCKECLCMHIQWWLKRFTEAVASVASMVTTLLRGGGGGGAKIESMLPIMWLYLL